MRNRLLRSSTALIAYFTPMSFREAIRKRTLYLAPGDGRNGCTLTRPTLDAAGRYRLAQAPEDLDAGDRGMSDDEDSPVFMRLLLLLHFYSADGILHACFLLRCPISIRSIPKR
jgi:hypothetical protein